MHRTRERSPAVLQAAKAMFLRKHGKLICQAYDFFEDFYGDIGQGSSKAITRYW